MTNEHNTLAEPRFFIEHKAGDGFLNGKIGDCDWVLCYRDVTNINNERTAIGTILPRVALMQPLNGVSIANAVTACTVLAALNSLVVDFVARQRFSGRHLNVTTFSQLPYPAANNFQRSIVSRVASLLNRGLEFKPFFNDLGLPWTSEILTNGQREVVRAELDAYYAKLYGLTRDELRYILDPADIMGEDYPSETFRVLKEKEQREFGEYRTQRLVLAAWDKLETGELH